MNSKNNQNEKKESDPSQNSQNGKRGKNKRGTNTAKTYANKKWLSWLDYECIRTYLNGSIGSKSDVIGDSITLEDKIKTVNLSQSLRGVEVFLKHFSNENNESYDFPIVFNEPYEIIDYFSKIRADQLKVNEFIQLIESFIRWLKAEKPKGFGLAASTSQTYQAMFRGFLTWNNIILKFKNYDEETETSKIHDKYNIQTEDLLEMSFKIIEYANDFEFKTFLKLLQTSGLGSREVFEMTIGDLTKNQAFVEDREYVKISKRRIKTGVKYTTFIYGEVKDNLRRLINLPQNKDKSEEDFIFGEKGLSRARAYNNFSRKFKRAYNRVINEQYPHLANSKRAIFTMHKFRHIFVSMCVELRIPKKYENRFVAHKQTDKLEKRYVLDKDLLENFKLIQNAIFGIKESSTREEIKREIIENLTESLMNRGKRVSQYKKSKAMSDEEIKELEVQSQFNILTERIIDVAKQELLKDDSILDLLADKLVSRIKDRL